MLVSAFSGLKIVSLAESKRFFCVTMVINRRGV
jgi:hypothetical protein